VTSACVVVPAYKEAPTKEELAAWEQVRRVLSAYPVILLCPQGMDRTAYDEGASDWEPLELPHECFASISAYNRLMLDRDFYQLFARYEFTLVYQLDGWVFRDELAKWCSEPLDYVGAPWAPHAYLRFALRRWPLRALRMATSRHRGRVGNGGVSLRRNGAFISFLDRHPKEAESWTHNEDVFWGIFAAAIRDEIRVPTARAASHFSVEEPAEAAVEAMGGRLPFACHAWQRYEEAFWRRFIQTE
jgi:hypothetical protein